MDGSIRISRIGRNGKERMLVFFNQIADGGLKEMAKLLAPSSTCIEGNPITHCQLGIGGMGTQYQYTSATLNNGISDVNHGIEAVNDAVLIHDGFTTLFSFRFNQDDLLYGYLSSIGNPDINEIALLVNYTTPVSINTFCAKDFNYGTLPFGIESTYAYEIKYELKFGREVSSSSSGYM